MTDTPKEVVKGDDHKHIVLVGGMRVVRYARLELEKLLDEIKGNSIAENEEVEVAYPTSLAMVLLEGGEILTSEANKTYKIIDEIRSNLF